MLDYIVVGISNNIIISSDVPQGVILSLLFFLFSLMVWTVFYVFLLLIFAGNMKLFMRIRNENDASLIQSDLD